MQLESRRYTSLSFLKMLNSHPLKLLVKVKKLASVSNKGGVVYCFYSNKNLTNPTGNSKTDVKLVRDHQGW